MQLNDYNNLPLVSVYQNILAHGGALGVSGIVQ